MRIVWDEPKRLVNLVKHGIDFGQFEATFDWSRVVFFPARPSPRTGRRRAKVLGLMSSGVVLAVLSPLGDEAISIVSVRPASIRKRRAYAD